VQIVDDEGVGMVLCTLTLPKVRMLGRELRVSMGKDFGIVGRPERDSQASTKERKDTERAEGRRKAGCRAQPTCQGICDEPTGVGEGELSGEESRPIGCVRRAP
jgi:hypothetical protein